MIKAGDRVVFVFKNYSVNIQRKYKTNLLETIDYLKTTQLIFN